VAAEPGTVNGIDVVVEVRGHALVIDGPGDQAVAEDLVHPDGRLQENIGWRVQVARPEADAFDDAVFALGRVGIESLTVKTSIARHRASAGLEAIPDSRAFADQRRADPRSDRPPAMRIWIRPSENGSASQDQTERGQEC
jgi:hypothetical protein